MISVRLSPLILLNAIQLHSNSNEKWNFNRIVCVCVSKTWKLHAFAFSMKTLFVSTSKLITQYIALDVNSNESRYFHIGFMFESANSHITTCSLGNLCSRCWLLTFELLLLKRPEDSHFCCNWNIVTDNHRNASGNTETEQHQLCIIEVNGAALKGCVWILNFKHFKLHSVNIRSQIRFNLTVVSIHFELFYQQTYSVINST